MSRARPATGPAISLFPFLAVLLCTMGALLVLLVLFSRAAQESETARAEAAALERAEELELAREDLRWRLAQVEEIRGRTAADLARARMQLAGAEDDLRTLEDELATLERTAAAAAAPKVDGPAVDEAAVAALEARLAAAAEAIDAARRDKDGKRPAYAVVPYAGRHGTGRRPLYIECCIDGVFLQPEGIRLGPADFDGPPGPGNPLASALRAAREHIARSHPRPGDVDAQPYPLLLVRPSGVMAYYAAREAIQSWGSEFGYQFVDEDWELAFPPADPALAEVERRAVEESRQRLAWLAQVRPTRPAQPQPQYRAATTRGGVVPLGGPSVLGDRSRFTWRESDAAAGDGSGRGPGGGPNGSRGDGPGSGRDLADGSAGGSAAGGVGNGTGSGPGGRGLEGDGTGGPAFGADGRYVGPSRFYAGHGGTDTQGGGTAGGSVAGDGGPTNGLATQGTTHEQMEGDPGGAAGASEAASAGMAAGGGRGAGSGGAGSAEETAAATSRTGGGGGGGSGPSMPGQGSGGGAMSAATGSSASGSLASGRGSNWASLATPDRPIPITRPIRVECAAAEFRILDETGRRIETRVSIGNRTADAVDPLVKAVHAKVAGWGIAGDRMYWRPELVLSETPDGRGRREDLERLLADSGLDTRPATAAPLVRPLPPVNRTGGMFPRR